MNDLIIEYTQSIASFIYSIFPTVATCWFAIVLLVDRDKLKIKLDSVGKFITILAIVGLVKICLWNGNLVNTNPYKINMVNFLFVFLEDVFFVMIPAFICSRINSKIFKVLIWVLFSAAFGSGHLYQGFVAVLITSIYPYFISYRYAKRTSFGTVMVCHFIWDCFTIILPKINNLIAFM